jgi:hypothetical protein
VRALDALGDSSGEERGAPGKAVAATRRRPGAAVVPWRAPASSAQDLCDRKEDEDAGAETSGGKQGTERVAHLSTSTAVDRAPTWHLSS